MSYRKRYTQPTPSPANPAFTILDDRGSPINGDGTGARGYCSCRKGVDMTDKSPRKTTSKKAGKTLKEKRQAKKEKEVTRKGLGR
jgi:hypothetical protein